MVDIPKNKKVILFDGVCRLTVGQGGRGFTDGDDTLSQRGERIAERCYRVIAITHAMLNAGDGQVDHEYGFF